MSQNQEIFNIQKGKSGYVMGSKATNLKQMKETSGAEIEILGRKNQPCQAKITGT
ncbi:18827_t:CDS:2, partial [Funneliformis geosporum]